MISINQTISKFLIPKYTLHYLTLYLNFINLQFNFLLFSANWFKSLHLIHIKICFLILSKTAMIRSIEIFKAAGCPLVTVIHVIHDTINSSAETALAVVTIIRWVIKEVMSQSKVVAKFMSQNLFKVTFLIDPNSIT